MVLFPVLSAVWHEVKKNRVIMAAYRQ